MKILDRYIFFSFLKNFLAVLTILTLIFLLQSVWQMITELAGKDLDFEIIAKLLLYLIPSLLPLVLPLTILVSSIMTFGNFAEKSEFAAMKASGISLQRIMLSLVFFITALSIGTFFAASHAVPWSNFKYKNLFHNIKGLKPALALAEGEFNQIGDYNIKVAKKTGENGQDLHDITIHIKEKNNEMTVVKAEKGKLLGNQNTGLLTLILYDGASYQEYIQGAGTQRQRERRPFVKNHFEESRLYIDVSDHNNVDVYNERYDNLANMLNVRELKLALDSLSTSYNSYKTGYYNTLLSRSGINRIVQDGENLNNPQSKEVLKKLNKRKDSVLFNKNTQQVTPYEGDTLSIEEKKLFVALANTVFPDQTDSVINLSLTDQNRYTSIYDSISHKLGGREKKIIEKYINPPSDSSQLAQPKTIFKVEKESLDNLFESFDLEDNLRIADIALSSSKGTLQTVSDRNEKLKLRREQLNITEIEIHDKYALAVMCYVLFFVGAPLGAIIRKGGIGTPMVVAISLFLAYLYIGMFAKNSAKTGGISPFVATWLSTFIMLPLSVFVTYRATTDRGFGDREIVEKIYQKIANFFKKSKNRKSDR